MCKKENKASAHSLILKINSGTYTKDTFILKAMREPVMTFINIQRAV